MQSYSLWTRVDGGQAFMLGHFYAMADAVDAFEQMQDYVGKDGVNIWLHGSTSGVLLAQFDSVHTAHHKAMASAVNAMASAPIR